MNDDETCRKYNKISKDVYDQIQRLLKTKKVSEICSITYISRARIYHLKRFFETSIDPTFENFVINKWCARKDFTNIEAKVRKIFGRDNSLMQQ